MATTTEATYTCEFCGFESSAGAGLAAHKRAKHPEPQRKSRKTRVKDHEIDPTIEAAEQEANEVVEEAKGSILVRGAARVMYAGYAVKNKARRGVNRVLNGASNHPIVTGTAVAGAAAYGLKKHREKLREEIAEDHAYQHQLLFDAMHETGLDESATLNEIKKALRHEIRQAVDDERRDFLKELEAAAFKAGRMAAKDVNERWEKSFAQSN